MSSVDTEPPQQPEATFAIIAVLCGVLGIAICLAASAPWGTVIGAFGLTTGLRARGGNVRRQIATVGAVLSAAAVVVGVVAIIVSLVSAP